MLKDQQTEFPPGFDVEEANAGMEAAKAEERFWATHYAEYLERYPEQFVAVQDGQVVATNLDLYELIRELERKGIAPTQTWLRLVTANPYRILH